MEGQELKDLSIGCDCDIRIAWIHLISKVVAANALKDVVIENYKTYFSMRRKFTHEVLNDTQKTQAKIIFQIVLAMSPDIKWDQVLDEELIAKVTEVWDIAAGIPDSIMPPQNP